MKTYIFPGQGSQAKGMGGELFAKFSKLSNVANDVLGYSIADLCLRDLHQQLNLTQFTQPALYVVNALTFFNKIEESPSKFDYVIGHSLGEYNALLAAGVFDFETGLRLVKKRSELMSQAVEGAMAAIVGLREALIQDLIKQKNLSQVTIANYNSHTQLVISGPKNEIDIAIKACEQAGAMMAIPLKVSGAFHSPLMASAQQEYAGFISQFKFSLPSVPVISNVTARPYQVNALQENLVKQISQPVRWTESIEFLVSQGVVDFEEIGPGSVLSGLIRRIKNGQ